MHVVDPFLIKSKSWLDPESSKTLIHFFLGLGLLLLIPWCEVVLGRKYAVTAVTGFSRFLLYFL